MFLSKSLLPKPIIKSLDASGEIVAEIEKLKAKYKTAESEQQRNAVILRLKTAAVEAGNIAQRLTKDILDLAKELESMKAELDSLTSTMLSLQS